MNTQENNKLIAEFMGLKNHFNNQGVTKVLIDGNEHIQDWECYDAERDILITPIEMKYHTSWDWLMPVVEKIRNVTSYDRDKFSTEVIIYGNKTTIKSGGYGEKRHSNLFFNKTELGTWNTIEPTYQVVVEYIKWYNKNNK